MPISTNNQGNEFEQLQQVIQNEVKEIEKWWSEPRWNQTQRNYSARDIALRRGTFDSVTYPSSVMADKLFKVLEKHNNNGTASRTFGAMDPVQIT